MRVPEPARSYTRYFLKEKKYLKGEKKRRKGKKWEMKREKRGNEENCLKSLEKIIKMKLRGKKRKKNEKKGEIRRGNKRKDAKWRNN